MVFHNINFYSTTLISDERYQHISMPSWYRPLHSRFSSVRRRHSHHRYFIDSRRVICIQYLYCTFVSRVATLLRQTSADFIELQTPAITDEAGRSIRVGISGRYSFILPIGLSVVAHPCRDKPDAFSITWP